jgi:hypothetical protein
VVWLQVAAVLAGVVCLAFFALFAGYYFRNRKITLGARTSADEARPRGGLRSSPGSDDDDAGTMNGQSSNQ